MPVETRSDAPLFPRLGAGVGLRTKHHAAALESGAALPDFFELITENFFAAGGRPREVLEEARRRRPIALHGVSLSIGSRDPLDASYLDRVAELADRVQPAIVSDHLCWSSHGGRHAHDLLPLVFTAGEVDRIAARVREVQVRLGRRILLENVSSYLAWNASTMTEWAFLAAVAEQADAGILLDVNNVYVNAKNHGFDPAEFLAGLPAARVGQIHLAGHADRGRYLFDTHDAPVGEPVWALYRAALERFGPVSTLIERDDKIPAWEVLLAEATAARTLMKVTPGRVLTFSGTPRAEESKDTPRSNASLLFSALLEGDTAVLPHVSGGALSPAERVAIYATSYFARLHDALLEDFPATDALLGHERFHAAAQEYSREHPSTSPDLADFGAGFAAFLRVAPEAELAALEWARVESFRGADAPALDPLRLAAIAAERWAAIRFVPHPSLRLVAASTRIDAVWRDADREKPITAPGAESGSLRIWRQQNTVYHSWMAAAESAALDALVRGETLATAAERSAALGAAEPEKAAALLNTWLGEWLTDGIFTDLR